LSTIRHRAMDGLELTGPRTGPTDDSHPRDVTAVSPTRVRSHPAGRAKLCDGLTITPAMPPAAPRARALEPQKLLLGVSQPGGVEVGSPSLLSLPQLHIQPFPGYSYDDVAKPDQLSSQRRSNVTSARWLLELQEAVGRGHRELRPCCGPATMA
jgi:hypothetical protein